MAGNEDAVVGGLNEFIGGMRDVNEVDPNAEGKVLAVIFTDGQELHSKESTRDSVASLISEKEDEGWTFIYLGANQDAWGSSKYLGFSGGARGRSYNYVSTPQGTRSAYGSVLRSSLNFLSCNNEYEKSGVEMSSGTITESGEVLDKLGNVVDADGSK